MQKTVDESRTVTISESVRDDAVILLGTFIDGIASGIIEFKNFGDVDVIETLYIVRAGLRNENESEGGAK